MVIYGSRAWPSIIFKPRVSASRPWFLTVVHEITGSIPLEGFIKFVGPNYSLCILFIDVGMPKLI